MSLPKIWTESDDEQLLALAAEGISFDVIGEEFKCSRSTASDHYVKLLRIMSRPARAAAKRARDENFKLPKGRTHIAAESAIADRDARANLAHTSITAFQFGDPLPGRSALDRRAQQ